MMLEDPSRIITITQMMRLTCGEFFSSFISTKLKWCLDVTYSMTLCVRCKGTILFLNSVQSSSPHGDLTRRPDAR